MPSGAVERRAGGGHPPRPRRRPPAAVATEAGELRGPDLLVTIALADADERLEVEIGA